MDRPKIVTVKTPAKVNLYLDVLSKRPDGYHNIDTVMAAIDWWDELTIERSNQRGVRVDCQWSDPVRRADELQCEVDDDRLRLPQDGSNLVGRVLRRWSDRLGLSYGLDVRLRKRIPAGAGLGGGSSNAAGALRAAAVMESIPQADMILGEIAAAEGSDLNFFLPKDEANICEGIPHVRRASGRGTELEELDEFDADALSLLRERWLVVAFPPVVISTAAAYGALIVDASDLERRRNAANSFCNELSHHPVGNWPSKMFNRMESAVRGMAAPIDSLCGIMIESRSDGSLMTGSGSAVFAIFGSSSSAMTLCDDLQSRGGVVAVKARFCGLDGCISEFVS
ncbi:MAG: hypothetical protein AAF664_21730 [Planctomycetota bacterium]